MPIHIFRYDKHREKTFTPNSFKFSYLTEIKLNVVIPTNVQYIKCVYNYEGDDMFKMSTSQKFFPYPKISD